MANLTETNNNLSLDLLKQQAGLQKEQAGMILQIVENMDNQEKRVDKKIGRVETLVEDVSRKVHLDDKESHDIQSGVNKKAWLFAQILLEEKGFSKPFDTNLTLSKQGHLRSRLYSRLKKEFNVTKYTHIPHEKFKDAINFINSIEYNQLNSSDKRWTPSQQGIIERIVG